jgi:hypothetical protein
VVARQDVVDQLRHRSRVPSLRPIVDTSTLGRDLSGHNGGVDPSVAARFIELLATAATEIQSVAQEHGSGRGVRGGQIAECFVAVDHRQLLVRVHGARCNADNGPDNLLN